jgi:hypothetical protein
MRHSPILAAALLAFAMLAPCAASAFELDNTSGTNPDGSPRYADPDEAPLQGPLGGVVVKPGAQFGGTATGSSSPSSTPSSWEDLGWANPQPRTRLGR